MPSFDVVCKPNLVELRNAVDQANKEISNRFDFKGSDARFELKELELTAYADDEFKLGQVRDVLMGKLASAGRPAPARLRQAGEDRRRQAEAGRQGAQRHRVGARQEDRRDGQGIEAQGLVEHSRRRRASHRREARHVAGSDCPVAQGRHRSALTFENFRD